MSRGSVIPQLFLTSIRERYPELYQTAIHHLGKLYVLNYLTTLNVQAIVFGINVSRFIMVVICQLYLVNLGSHSKMLKTLLHVSHHQKIDHSFTRIVKKQSSSKWVIFILFIENKNCEITQINNFSAHRSTWADIDYRRWRYHKSGYNQRYFRWQYYDF